MSESEIKEAERKIEWAKSVCGRLQRLSNLDTRFLSMSGMQDLIRSRDFFPTGEARVNLEAECCALVRQAFENSIRRQIEEDKKSISDFKL